MKSTLSITLVALFLFSACSVYDLTKLPASDVHEIYEKSLEDAVYPTESKVDRNLFAINKSNSDLTWKMINGEEYVLVVSWKSDSKWYKPPNVTKEGVYNTGSSHPFGSLRHRNWLTGPIRKRVSRNG